GASTCTNETFRGPTLTIEAEDNGTVAPLGSADFNRDGFDDLVTDETTYSPTGAVSHRLRVYPGAAQNLSRPGTSFELVNAGPLQFFPGPDLNADGYADLAVGAGASSILGGEHFALAYYRGSSAGLITSAQQGSQLQGAGYASAVASLGDFNGDGRQDLVLERSNITGDTDLIRVEVFLGNAGSFESPAEWSSTVRVVGVDSSYSSAIDARGDLDGDGLSDIAVLAGANLYGGGPIRNGENVSGSSQSAVLLFYGRQVVQYLSGVGPVGFDRGVAYPAYEYGFDVTAKAASASVFDRVAVVTTAGNFSYYPPTNSFAFEPNTSLAPGEFARVRPSSSAAFDNATQSWDIRMRFEFTWHFPTEAQVPYSLVASGPSVPPVVPAAPAGSFRVEKDIELAGELQVSV
ncbi:MAG: FG-GAP repeat domain-containing protein, partial [Actinomycetota bacterium]